MHSSIRLVRHRRSRCTVFCRSHFFRHSPLSFAFQHAHALFVDGSLIACHCYVDCSSAVERETVGRAHGVFGVSASVVAHESEATRFARASIPRQVHVADAAVLFEEVTHVLRCACERQIVDLLRLHFEWSSLSLTFTEYIFAISHSNGDDELVDPVLVIVDDVDMVGDVRRRASCTPPPAACPLRWRSRRCGGDDRVMVTDHGGFLGSVFTKGNRLGE